MPRWTQDQAVLFSREVEMRCLRFRCHIALTGGTLYKDGERKDLDLMLFRERQEKVVDTKALFEDFRKIGLFQVSDHGWVVKFKYQPQNAGKDFNEWDKHAYDVDILIPEEDRVTHRDGEKAREAAAAGIGYW